MRTEMRARLGINNCFAVKRWPHPDDWASIVSNDLGLDTVELSLDLLAGPDTQCGLDHLLVENLVTDREPSTMALIEDITAERAVARAPVQLCLDLGHPFVCGGSPRDRDPYAWLEHFGPRIAEVQLQQSDGLADHHWPFTPERNAVGRVDPGRILDTLAGAGVTDVPLILEVIPPFEQDDRQVIGDLRASADLWRRALAERARS